MRPQFAIVWASFQDIAQKNDRMTIGRCAEAKPATPLKALPYNPAMRHLDLLLPFSLPSQDLAADLLRALRLPSFALLAARARAGKLQAGDGFARALPHETWLAERFSLQAGLAEGGSPPVAPAAMAASGLEAGQGRWFMLQPAHLHVARDHLVLTDQRQLALDEQASRALFDSAQALLADVGVPLLYGDAGTWFLRAADWHGLQTSTIDAACGHNIDIWMPKGPDERAWRKLQNEIQMEWHAHPVNEERAARDLKPVNSVWLWGGGQAGTDVPASGYSHAWGLGGWASALAASVPASSLQPDAASVIAAAPARGLLMIDTLSAPALAGDWSVWLDAWHAIEADWLAPLLAALQAGKLDTLTLVLGDGTRLLELAASRGSLRKFWVQPSLSRLVP
jgi:hypothetical protein